VTDSQGPNTPSLEMAHVLFMDIVAYSVLHMDRQQQLLHDLQEAVRNTSAFNRAQAEDQLIRLPTGDGMALVFFRDPEAPVRCALELTKILRDHAEIKLRMGIHTGPVYRVADINANRNVAGGGINIAQRVMDCGDAGHILVSSAEAEVLGQVSAWCSMLHDLGEVEVKHGVRIHLYSLHTTEAGNSELPKKISTQRATPSPAATATKSKRLATLTVAGVAFLAVASVGGWLFYAHKAHALTDKDTIILADFSNTTGDPIFDDTLKTALNVSLRQSPFLNVLSDSEVAKTLQLMTRPADTKITLGVARELCQRAGSKAYLAGSIGSLGSQYVLGVKAVNCRSGDTLAEEQVTAASKEKVLDTLGEAATKLRGELGESLATVQKLDVPLAEATTSSLEALKAYSLAGKTHLEKGDAAAIPFLKRAIELDPDFAMAYIDLGYAYFGLEEFAKASENIRRAYDLRDRVSEREKCVISANYYDVVTGELEKEIQTYEFWSQAYPRSSEPRFSLGYAYATLGQYEKAVTETLDAMRLDPQAGDPYPNLVLYYAFLNRLGDATAAYEQALAHKIDDPLLHANRYSVAFLQGDTAEMARQVARAVGNLSGQDVLLSFQSDTEAYYGRFAKARELSQRAVESARRNDRDEAGAEWQLTAALREAEVGYSEPARQQTAVALALAPTRDVRILAALALARAGELSRPQKMADDLEKENPRNTMIQGYWLPAIRATIEINRSNPARATELLRASAPYDFANPLPSPTGGTYIYPNYVRGQAYLLARQGNRAATEFEKYLDHRSIVINCPLGALARLGLARAHVLQGDTAEARAAYKDFLTLWKDADPDIPILKQAKAEYAKLQ
jgi:tetratricopeptide (TPR) repeat protein/class 3 adenylate cyclase